MCAKVEEYLWVYIEEKKQADIIIIDPPRAWLHPKALSDVIQFWVPQIIYVSCNPSTLSRDLQTILKESEYMIESVTPMDMFPHTHHIETIVNLTLKNI